jgi:hypothetical protein
MPLGAFAPLPFRLGGSPEEGWTASQHARAAADLVALVRSSPLAVLTVNKSGSTVPVESYHGQNGVGLGHAPTTASGGTGIITLTWGKSYQTALYIRLDREDEDRSWTVRQAVGSIQGSAHRDVACSVADNVATVRITDAGTPADGRVTVEVWGSWLPLPAIGTYGGDLNKQDSATEADVPYAAACYRDIQGMRGSAYSTERRTIVHAENLARARFWAYFAFRLPEKVAANATPARADEKLPYWVDVLGVTVRPGDEAWQIRQRCVTAFRASPGPTYDTIETTLRDLLGTDIYVGLLISEGASLSAPPTLTFWPGVNPGPDVYDIGGGAWLSERAHIGIDVVQPPSMTNGEFRNLMNVQMFEVVSKLLPAWCTFAWFISSESGFLLDISRLDFDRL